MSLRPGTTMEDVRDVRKIAAKIDAVMQECDRDVRFQVVADALKEISNDLKSEADQAERELKSLRTKKL